MSDEQQLVFSDRYEMVKHIARGGMAQVYLARDLLLDRPVALKVLFPELSVDRSFVERFRREAKAAANLSHPNIVSVYDWGQGEHTYFIVMEFVDGNTLSQMLKKGTIDPARAASIGASVAAALDFAHRRGVIHRDVKPGNVLIDDRGEVKVADFGIARAAGTSGEDLTQTGSVMGTATYFSPEQAQGYPVDARSDVYSLGVVLYEMATGKPPFTGENPVSIAYKHVKEPAPSPSQVNPNVPAAFEAIILKAMAKDPAARYQTAEELRADLLRFTSGQPVTAGADGTQVMAAAAGATSVMGAVDPTRVQPGVGGGGGGTTVLSTTRGRGPGGMGPPPEEDSRAWLWILAVVLIIALGLGGYFAGRAAGLWGSSAKTVTVPSDLVGKPQATAESELQGLGFSNIKTQDKNSSAVATGDVISTDPGSGTSMKSNAAITLVISGGAVQVTVPSDLVGKPAATAAAELTQDGFVPTQTAATSSSVAQGDVISTNPAGGTKAGQGSNVQLVVSSGKQQVTIPTLTGQNPATAGQILGAAGLTVAGETSEASTSVPAGEVTRTNPPAGTPVPVGSSVTIYVSSGAPQVTVPDLSHDTEAAAKSALSNAGLQGSFSTVTVTDPSQNGIVQSQNPGANQTVTKGSTVAVTIGSYQSTSTTSQPSSTTTTTSLPIG